MNAAEFQKAYNDENRRDYVAAATLGTFVSMPLNLFCSIMDYFMYPDRVWVFFKARVLSTFLVGLVWVWFRSPLGRSHRRLFGVTWFMSPLVMILWMIYAADDPNSPYYAGLNIVLLAVGLISPWTYVQNLLTTIFVLAMYIIVVLSMHTPQPVSAIINNTTFLVLTAVLVVCGSVANARQRYREFSLRYELEENRKIIEENNRKLVELDQAKSRFFANISHELRTPLTLLLAPLDALRARFGGLLDQDGQELLVTMRANGMRLLKLINDLLDLVRLQEGRVKIDRTAVDVGSLVRALTSSIHHTAATREVKVTVEIEENIPPVLLDQDKLEKVLLNLLFNALKFTNAGGQVALRVLRKNQELVFVVSDTGIGISQEDVSQLFQRFWQADTSSNRRHQGAGIGLALVRELTEVQGGRVEVQSELGKGTKFTVSLPLHEATGVQSEALGSESGDPAAPADSTDGGEEDSWLQSLYREAQLSPAEGERMPGRTALYARPGFASSTVLVADDEPDMLRFIRAQLGTEHRIISARNGREAVERARESQPSVIVLDMMMPEMDGIQACGVLRKDAVTAHIPIIMLTARADEETKLAALAAGANDFIAKPFSVTELHVRVRNLMETHFSRMELSKQNRTLEETLEMLRETEMQLLQSEKLASVGELSAGMSHEVKNPLNYALTGVYALKKRAGSFPESERAEYQELVGTVEEGVRRVMETVNTLRELVHPQVENRQEFRAGEVVEAALRLLQAEWKGRVLIHQSIAEGTSLYANKSMILLVFLNLLKNAVDSLQGGASNADAPAIWINVRETDGRVVVSIRDNGPGISEENQVRVFDILGMGDSLEETQTVKSGSPSRVFKHFFSTKAPGAGMGMGLSICRRIVRAHGGKISFRTEPGAMCEFLVDLPAHKVVEAMK
ncbi:MAG: ATP-binding protein [Verrucomicrobia bacterium]|nr:ATP-binding protein [Verrucomicrobiota bacterium]